LFEWLGRIDGSSGKELTLDGTAVRYK